VTNINIEGETAYDIAKTQLLPAAVRYLVELNEAGADKSVGVGTIRSEVDTLVAEFVSAIEALGQANIGHPEEQDNIDHARYVQTEVIPAMERVRAVADRLERVVPDRLWPLPKYSEILFVR